MMEVNDDDLVRIVNEAGAGGNNQEFLDYHPIQLMCFENFDIDPWACICHGYNVIDPGLAVACNFRSEFVYYLDPALRDEPLLCGVYFVASWACPVFYDFHPVFLDPPIGMDNIRGVTIHVTEVNRIRFVECVAKMCELGAIPCQYMRKVDVYTRPNTMILFADLWFGQVSEFLLCWQQTETERLYDAD